MEFITSLKQKLNGTLPGITAQLKMVPAYKKYSEIYNKELKEPIPAAVLICLYPENGKWKFILTERTDTVEFHRNQISLPGGAKENKETFEQTALRESFEEIGLDSEKVNIIGELSPLLIPVSGFIVYPFVGLTDNAPILVPEPQEVAQIHNIYVSDLLDDTIQKSEMRKLKEIDVEVPYFHLGEIKVWGATAAILSEFKEIILLPDKEEL